MVSNGGPEEDSAVGVWKSLLEWECRGWGSTQRSAPETATGPSCHAQGDPATQIYQPHTHIHTHAKKTQDHKSTHFDCDHLQKLCSKEGIFFSENVPNLLKVNFICYTLSVAVVVLTSHPEMMISEKGINFKWDLTMRQQPRRQQKQKAWKNCSVSNLLQTATGI